LQSAKMRLHFVFGLILIKTGWSHFQNRLIALLKPASRTVKTG
jgi:hypothetical protein